MLDAGHLDADCLGQGIRVGSWLADLFSCCTYNHVPPNFLNRNPIVLLLASARFSTALRLSLPATPPLSPCFLGPIFLFPVSPPRRPTTRARDLLPFLYDPPPHYARLASHLILRAPGGRTRQAGLGSRAHITERRLLAADATRASTGLSLRIPPIPEVWVSHDKLRYGHQRRSTIKGLSASHSVNK